MRPHSASSVASSPLGTASASNVSLQSSGTPLPQSQCSESTETGNIDLFYARFRGAGFFSTPNPLNTTEMLPILTSSKGNLDILYISYWF